MLLCALGSSKGGICMRQEAQGWLASGGMKSSVPTHDLGCSSARSTARPRSHRRTPPSSMSRTFSGLMSRCMMFCMWPHAKLNLTSLPALRYHC